MPAQQRAEDKPDLAPKPPLSPLEEAKLFDRFLKRGNVSQRDVAQQLGVSQARVSQRLALLRMPRLLQKLMTMPEVRFTERHARAVRRLPTADLQVWLAKRIAEDQLTTTVTDEIVQDMLVELGVVPSSQLSWFRAPGLRWRRRDGRLEIRVDAATEAQERKALERFIKTLRHA